MFGKKKNKEVNDERKIVYCEGSSFRVIEAYNRLKDNILYMSADGKNRVIQIESASSGEGKSTVVANLAVALGQTEKKVCIVDLDFRKPKTHTFFELSKEVGISEYMRGEVKKEEIIKHTSYHNVDLVTGGGTIHNSSLILVSEVFKQLITWLKGQYDYVLLDCAPVLQISDYIHIAKVSDGVLFVVAYAQTTKAEAQEAIKELKRNNINILGSVFAKYDAKEEGDKYYTQYYYKDEE